MTSFERKCGEIAATHKKLRMGDPTTTKELQDYCETVGPAADLLFSFGERYALTACELRNYEGKARDYLRARGYSLKKISMQEDIEASTKSC